MMVDTKVHGPILIRARELQTNAGALFARVPFHPVGQAGDGIPTGTVVRTDDIQGTKLLAYPEVVLDTSRPYPLTKKGSWPMFKNYVGYPKAATGSVGLRRTPDRRGRLHRGGGDQPLRSLAAQCAREEDSVCPVQARRARR